MNENSFRFLSAMSEIEERFIAEASGYPPAAFRHSPKRILRFLLAAALILSLCLLGLAAAGVVKLPAIDAWFLRRAAGYEDASLSPLSGDNYRVLEDNDTLTIEAVDTLYSGSSLRAAFLVTLKTLDDAYDSPVPSPLAGWRFEDSALLGAGGRLVKGEIRFLYEKDSDDLEFRIKNYKKGKTYRFTLSGVKQIGDVSYGKVSGKVKIPAKTGWTKVSGKKAYIEKNGKTATGVTRVGKNYYLFNSKGQMLTGWQRYDGDWYYLQSNGVMIRNQSLVIDGKTYLFDDDGECENR